MNENATSTKVYKTPDRKRNYMRRYMREYRARYRSVSVAVSAQRTNDIITTHESPVAL